MVIRFKRFKKIYDECGESFESYTIEHFLCPRCSLKGKTYKKLKGDL